MILEQLTQIGTFVIESFLRLWPYLLLSIPLAVAVRMSSASQLIGRVFAARPLLAILLATLVGAFSPFCACTVVPVIASLLIAGVPLGPVMAFWVASPTMDPEIFLLSVGLLGPELALVRVLATLLLSLSAGYTAHWLEAQQFFREGILRAQKRQANWSWKRLATPLLARLPRISNPPQPALAAAVPLDMPITSSSCTASGCGTTPTEVPASGSCTASGCGTAPEPVPVPLWQRLWTETRSAALLVAKFMLLAFLLEALIMLYVPQEAIIALLGTGNPLAIPFSALVGVPVYTTNLTALPLISGLLEQGMLPGAALAFLIAGPTTTLPAMTAVFGIARPRVFALYVGVALAGAVLLGYGYQALLLLG